jgi:hypothetical protein
MSEMLTMSRSLLEDFKRQARVLEKERILELLKEEQERTKLGFVQYKRILELLEVANER